ncbi:MAG: transferrin-binding protein-like solute binding protein [Phycisphaeraceae bacterium]
MHRIVMTVGLILVVLPLGGCSLWNSVFGSSSSSSSSSGNGGGDFTWADPTYAEDETALHELDEGETGMPMYQQAFEADGGYGTPMDDQANFILRFGTGEDDGMMFVTIETPQGDLTWNDHDHHAVIGAPNNSGVGSAPYTLDFLKFASGNGQTVFQHAWAYHYDYVAFGHWYEGTASHDDPSHPDFELDHNSFALFYMGLETDPNQLPTGSATYTGDVYGDVPGHPQSLHGDLLLTADFAGDAVTGEMTNMRVWDNGQKDFNDLAYEAGITGNRFDGTLTAGAAGDPDISVAEGAEGSVEGRFFGPEAEEVGGLWLIDDDGHRARGVFGGQR